VVASILVLVTDFFLTKLLMMLPDTAWLASRLGWDA
jgi:hypothetical protein